MSLIAELIRNNPDKWQDILAEKDIAIHEEGPLASFNYRISADFFDPVVREARGIILDMRTLDVVCYPFKKFGNFGEPYADTIDWDSARVLEKVDGSIMKLYWFNGEWRIATNATVNADNTPALNSGKMFGELFREAAERQKLDYGKLDKGKTYIFELTSPESRVIIDYGAIPKIWHIGTRDNLTEQEIEEDIGIVKPKEYPFSDLEACIEAVKMMNRDKEFVENEGFVAVDKDYHRIKIKSPEYILVHSVLPNGAVSDAFILEHIRGGDIDDILAYRPDIGEKVQIIKESVKDVEKRILAFIDYHKKKISREGISRKDFAIANKDAPYFPYAVGPIFSGREFDIDMIRTKALCDLISSRPILTVAVGIPGSGKTSYIREHGGKVVSSDAIREELLGDMEDQTQNGVVFAEFHKRIREALLAGESVYADATNISIKSRKGYADAMKIAWKTKAVIVAAPFEECVRRDAERERTVGTEVIERMMRRFEMPFAEEGFDGIEIVRTYPAREMTSESFTPPMLLMTLSISSG